MIKLDDEEAKDLLASKLEEVGCIVKGNAVKKVHGDEETSEDIQKLSIGSYLTAVQYYVNDDEMVPWCIYCDREKEYCICDDEEAKEKRRQGQMNLNEMGEEEKENLQQQVMEEVKKRLGEEKLEQLKERNKKDEMEWCPVCRQDRFKDLLYTTIKKFDGEKTIVGCKHCLGDYKK